MEDAAKTFHGVNRGKLDDVRPAPRVRAAGEVTISDAGSPPEENAFAVTQESQSRPSERSRSTYPGLAAFNRLDPRYTFDRFVVGSSNQFAYAASVAVSEASSEKYNPLFLYGPVGLGKTHLATAIAHQHSKIDRGRKLVFAPAELFMNDLISALRYDRINEFRQTLRQVDVLILDDVHFMASRGRVQEEFLHIFNDLHAGRHQMVLTSDRAPRHLSGFEQRLIERFESGLIAEVAPPDVETRVAIMQKKAVAEKVPLDTEVAIFIAERVSTSVRELEGCFNRIAALTSLNQRTITVELAREGLCDILRKQNIKLDVYTIQRHVADLFHIPLGDLKSKKRTQRLSFCRQVAMYLCRKLTGSSFPAIGDYFGRDHSTVIHAYNLIVRRVKNDGAFRGSLEKIERRLNDLRSSSRSI